MIEKFVLVLFGFAAGMLVSLLMDRKEKEDAAPQPVLIREEKRTVPVFAELEIPREELYTPMAESWIAGRLQAKLGTAIWPYTEVDSTYDQKDMIYRYNARIMVVDSGNRNSITIIEV